MCVLQDRIHIENGALTIVSVNLSDAGMYQCVAENKHGIIYFSAELVVLGKTFFLFFVFSLDFCLSIYVTSLNRMALLPS